MSNTHLADKPVSPPLKWHGGKHYLADWIISLMPPHTHYVEPFFGGGAVLLRKNPEGVSEAVNDLNQELANFWKILQHPSLFDRMARIVEAVPMAEVEFDGAIEAATKRANIWPDRIPDGIDRVQRAVGFFITARQSRQGLMKDFATLSRNRTRRGMNEQVSSWLTAIDGLPDVHARLKRVVILNHDAIDVIKQQDGPNTLFYCDPPYLHETRVTTSDYQHEMTPEQHAELLDALARIEGKFMLSGYPSKMYEHAAGLYGWHVETREIDNKASSKKTKETKTECLWMNFKPDDLGQSSSIAGRE